MSDLATVSRKVFEGYWPELCEEPCGPDRDPCEGQAVYRVRTADGTVFVCESHFGRLYRHFGHRDVDRLR